MAAVVIQVLEHIRDEEPRFYDVVEEAISQSIFSARAAATFKHSVTFQRKEIASLNAKIAQLRARGSTLERENQNLRTANVMLTQRLKDCYNEINPLVIKAEEYRAEVLRLRRMMATVVRKIKEHSDLNELTLTQKHVLEMVENEMNGHT